LEKCPAIAFCDRTVVTDEEGWVLSMRRRTNAYTFDPDLYRSWCAGGAVWLDDYDDPDHPSALQQSFSNPSACAEGNENEPGSPDPSNNNKNILFSTHYELSFSKSPDIQHPDCDGVQASACVCDLKSAEGQDQNSSQTSPIPEKSSNCAGISLWKFLQQDEGCCRNDSPPRIKARDSKPMDVPDHTT
jgi:hypothetical protein